MLMPGGLVLVYVKYVETWAALPSKHKVDAQMGRQNDMALID